MDKGMYDFYTPVHAFCTSWMLSRKRGASFSLLPGLHLVALD